MTAVAVTVSLASAPYSGKRRRWGQAAVCTRLLSITIAPTDGIAGDDRQRHQPAPPSYFKQLHVEFVVLLVVLSVGLSWLGWSWRPPASGFAPVPEDMTLTVYAKEAQSVTEILQRSSGTGATLQVLGNDVLRGPSGPWQVIMGNLGDGRLCTPTAYRYNGGVTAIFRLPSQHVTHPFFPTLSPGAPAYSSVSGSGILYVKFCWPADAPVEFRGPYLSADWPPGPDIDQFETNPQLLSVERVLVLGAGDDTANYAFQSPVVPNSSAQNQWEWDVSAADNIRVAAINISANQNETYRTFLSGIAFGVAGGVVVTLLQELVTPFNRRRDAKIGG